MSNPSTSNLGIDQYNEPTLNVGSMLYIGSQQIGDGLLAQILAVFIHQLLRFNQSRKLELIGVHLAVSCFGLETVDLSTQD